MVKFNLLPENESTSSKFILSYILQGLENVQIAYKLINLPTTADKTVCFISFNIKNKYLY